MYVYPTLKKSVSLKNTECYWRVFAPSYSLECILEVEGIFSDFFLFMEENTVSLNMYLNIFVVIKAVSFPTKYSTNIK